MFNKKISFYFKLIKYNITVLHYYLKHGFKESDLWGFDETCTSFILPRLIEFKKTIDCFPGEFNCIEEWIHCIDKMIYAFQLHRQFITKKITEKEFQDMQNGFMLFAKYYHNLWT